MRLSFTFTALFPRNLTNPSFFLPIGLLTFSSSLSPSFYVSDSESQVLQLLLNKYGLCETWGLATAEEFVPVPRLCRYILAVYEEDIRHPLWEPPGGYGINPDWLILKKTYQVTKGCAPPYILYLDHDHADIVLAIRGLNMAKESDYQVLLDNKLGKKKFDGGYVHNGLLKAAGWVLDAECDILKELVEKHPDYTLTFAGHSLGSGVASMLALVVVRHRDKLGNIDRRRIRCYAIAPARCMSLNLAVRYADVIKSVVLQDDFLPRTATPLEDIFKSLFWYGWLDFIFHFNYSYVYS
ncbi:hypothetical protein V6N13_032526 [Hibiscus sabdariffa]